MEAHCLTPACQTVIFRLTLDGASTVNFQLANSTGSIWKFASLDAILAGPGEEDVTSQWFRMQSETQIRGTALGFEGSPEPIVMRVTMASSGIQEDLFDGSLTYAGIANGAEPFSGSVSPEPSTVVLLLTGLFVLAFAVRRRKAVEIE
jgi:hypothetical protein